MRCFDVFMMLESDFYFAYFILFLKLVCCLYLFFILFYDQVDNLNYKLSQMDRQLKDKNRISEGKQQDEFNNEKNSEKINNLEELLIVAREENNKRVSETSQYQQMKKLMQTQSSNIKDLRRKLERYEPDNTKDDDDRF